MEKQQTIAVVTTHPIQYYAPIFQLLTSKGVRVKVFYTWGESVLKDKFDPGFGKVVSWDIPLLEGYEYTFVENVSTKPGSSHFNGIDNPSLIKELKDLNPHMLLVIGWNFKSHLQVLRHFKGKLPIVFRGDSTLINQKAGGIKRTLRKLFLTWVYKHIDYALYVGTENKKYYRFAGLKDRQLIFAPHAIENKRFTELGTDALATIEALKEKLHIENGMAIFLYAGKFEQVKNLMPLIDAFNDLAMTDACLVLVGNGPLETELKNRSRGNRNIKFLDFQNQSAMPLIYKMADVFVLPSISETWGLAINEAMASSKAILASSKVGCAVDLVKDGVNGYVFDSSNKTDLSNKISLLNANKGQLIKMGAASLDIIKHWNFEAIADAIIEATRKVKER